MFTDFALELQAASATDEVIEHVEEQCLRTIGFALMLTYYRNIWDEFA